MCKVAVREVTIRRMWDGWGVVSLCIVVRLCCWGCGGVMGCCRLGWRFGGWPRRRVVGGLWRGVVSGGLLCARVVPRSVCLLKDRAEDGPVPFQVGCFFSGCAGDGGGWWCCSCWEVPILGCLGFVVVVAGLHPVGGLVSIPTCRFCSPRAGIRVRRQLLFVVVALRQVALLADRRDAVPGVLRCLSWLVGGLVVVWRPCLEW